MTSDMQLTILTFVHMIISSCTTAIGSTFPVHLDVSSFPIGETPIRIDGFFRDELLTLATASIFIPPPGGRGCLVALYSIM